jgi:hypothetical protein
MGLQGTSAAKHWGELTEYLTHLGKELNRRIRSSILDQLRGWTITPGHA